MKLISIDVHAQKQSNVYDGRLRALTVPELRAYLNRLRESGDEATIILNAPITGYVREFEEIPSFSPALNRGIEYFFRNKGFGYSTTQVKGITVTGYSRLTYWTLVQQLFHLNLSKNTYGKAFVPVHDAEELSLSSVNLVETQSDVALWLLTGPGAAWDLGNKKNGFADFRDAFCASSPLPLPPSLLQALQRTQDLHAFNCVFSYVMAHLWLGGREGIGILGNRYTGSFLLPVDEPLLSSFTFFVQHTFINRLRELTETTGKGAYGSLARKLEDDNQKRSEAIADLSGIKKPDGLLTNHAIDRARERMGLDRKALKRHVKTVREKGLTLSETKGSLQQYLQSRLDKESPDSTAKVYGEYVYIFYGKQLVTLYRLPARLMKYLDLSREEDR